MSTQSDTPECPECGETVGQGASYCMHCYADLPDDDAETESTVDGVADTDAEWEAATNGDATESDTAAETATDTEATAGTSTSDGAILADDGLIDNSLTMIVGIAGGIIVGIVGTVVLGVATSSAWAIPVGIGVWLVSTAYLSRRHTVQAAIAHSGYAVALVFLSFPLLALSPAVSVSGGLTGRINTFAGYLVASVIMASIPAGVGWVASQFVSSD
ncbi:MAG: hypothetical protein J07HN6_01169 [Halonotius sp. J07HN6]|jgi:hypothetical protein|nr:MAG: hypothetical protein J07HN6_01169 [Halonotius sp. J07HN6]